jgi:hypothetical protein
MGGDLDEMLAIEALIVKEMRRDAEPQTAH